MSVPLSSLAPDRGLSFGRLTGPTLFVVAAILGAGALAIGAGPAAAAAAEPVQLGWNGVRDAGGSAEQAFPCDTVGGSDRIFLSFIAPDSITRFVAIDVVLELRAAGDSLPAWWEFHNSEACRTLSLRLDLEPFAEADSAARMPDPWDQGRNGIGLITGYRRDIDGDPRVAWISASMARRISQPAALEAGRRYVACAFVIDHRRTIGDYVCEGCREPITILVQKATLLETDGKETVLQPGDQACLGWQGASCGPSGSAGTAPR